MQGTCLWCTASSSILSYVTPEIKLKVFSYVCTVHGVHSLCLYIRCIVLTAQVYAIHSLSASPLFHECAQMLARHMTLCLMRRSGGCTTNTGSRGCRECPHTARINRSSMVRRYSSVCYCECGQCISCECGSGQI